MIHPVSDASVGEWIGDGLLAQGFLVGAFIPAGFEAYARLLHPAFEDRPRVREPTVRWAEIAAQAGASLRGDTSWRELTGDPADWTPHDPDEGSLPQSQAEALVSLLRPMTATPDSCYFGVWEGWGGVELHWPGAAQLWLPHGRTCLLLQGSIEDAAQPFNPPSRQSANLWWPEDRSWLVATEIDFHWTYIGGSASCIAQILADPRLETQPTGPHERAYRPLSIAEKSPANYASGGPIRWLGTALLRLHRRSRASQIDDQAFRNEGSSLSQEELADMRRIRRRMRRRPPGPAGILSRSEDTKRKGWRPWSAKGGG